MTDSQGHGITFNVRLDVVLGGLIKLEVSLMTAGGLEKMTFEGAFQPYATCEYILAD